MSTRETKENKTKGKQRIEMKKVEAYADRMITFSKRKAGINKKMYELMTMYDVEAAFLAFSQAGKPYSFASPSMEKIASRLMKDGNEKNVGPSPIVEAYRKQKVEDLMKQYMDLNEELKVETEKVKILKASRNEKELSKMWWKFPTEGSLSVKELQQRHQAFCEFHDSLCNTVSQMLGENGDGPDGSSSFGLAGSGSVGGDQA